MKKLLLAFGLLIQICYAKPSLETNEVFGEEEKLKKNGKFSEEIGGMHF